MQTIEERAHNANTLNCQERDLFKSRFPLVYAFPKQGYMPVG